MPLSDIKVRNLKSTDKVYKVSDFEGLYILVKVSGAKSWRFKYRIDGKERLLVIGDYPAVTLAKARQARDVAKAQQPRCHRARLGPRRKKRSAPRLCEGRALG